MPNEVPLFFLPKERLNSGPILFGSSHKKDSSPNNPFPNEKLGFTLRCHKERDNTVSVFLFF